jgi:hypothetical protein
MRSVFLIAAASAAALLAHSTAQAQTIGCEVGVANGGLIPASGTGGGTTFPTAFPPSPGVFALNVPSIPAGATHVTALVLNGLAHTWINDVQFVLTDPSGASHNVVCRPTGSCDFTGGTYTIVPPCTGGLSWPTTCTTTIPPGTYDQFFGTWPGGNLGVNNTVLDSIAAQTGNWTLTVYDWVGADAGSLASFDLCFGTPVAPSAPVAAPTLATPANGANVFGPNVTLTWAAVSCASSYEVDIDGTIYAAPGTSYTYTMSTVGAHTWTARGINGTGAGPWAASRTYNDLGPAPSPCNGQALTTLFASNNGGSAGGQVFFDIDVLTPAGINVAQLDTNTSLAVGTAFTLNVFTKAGTFVGFETNVGAWTQVASGAGISAGTDQPSLVEFPDFLLPQGVTGVALILVGGAHRYTGTSAAPPVTFYANADLTITGGKALNVPWSGTPFSPRMWNGRVRYNCTPPGPVSYCTAGTSTTGCQPTLSGQNLSATFASACSVTASNVDGQKSGILFYSISGQNNSMWCATSTSFLCVKAPTQRTGTQNSGGTAGICDGTLTLDVNAYLSANPTSLGQPFAAGNVVDWQGWYRDPPACKTTQLTDGLEMTVVP